MKPFSGQSPPEKFTADSPRRYSLAVQLLGALLFLLPLAAFVCLVLPFAPYREFEFVTVPEDACPGQEVAINVLRDVDEPTVGRLRDAEVSSFWENRDTGEKVSNARTVIPISPTPREEIQSPVLRTAPPSPGEWRLTSETRVNGFVGFMPRHQTFSRTAENTTEVLPAGSPGCDPDERAGRAN